MSVDARTPTVGPGRDHQLLLAASAAAALLTLTMIVWSWAALAALLTGQPTPSPGTAAHALIRLPLHLDDPALAWPAPAEERLPGPAVMYVLMVPIVVAWASLVVAALLTARRVGAGRMLTRHSGRDARWARASDLRPLEVDSGDHRGRILLGSHRGRLLAAEREASVLVVAPTRSGKTAGLAIPAILEWDGPVLATSIKTDLVANTHSHRATRGQVRVFDPAGITGLPSAGWSAVAAATDWTAARRVAAGLLRHSDAKPGSQAAFWADLGTRFLAPLLLAAHHTPGASMRDIVRWVEDLDQNQPADALIRVPEPTEQLAALGALESIWNGDSRMQSSVVQTVATALEAFQDPTVLRTADRAGITPHWLLAGHNTLYLCATADEQHRLRPLFLAVIRLVVAHVAEQSARRRGPIDPPLLLCLDEAANIAPLPDLDVIAATGGGQGLQLITVLHTLAQLEDRWGSARAATIQSSHRAQLFGTGLSDQPSLNYLTSILGEQAIEQRSLSHRAHALHDHAQVSRQPGWRPLAPAHRTREQPANTATLVYGNLPPTSIVLRPWFRDSRLRGLATAPLPPTPTPRSQSERRASR